MNDVRAKAKVFYNALDFDRPINFGQGELVSQERAQPESLYVPSLHGGDGTMEDPVAELVDQIDYSESAGAYLFTGNRGTGKTTELMRHVIALTIQEAPVAHGADVPMMVFMGGFDSGASSKTNSDPSDCLTFMYPIKFDPTLPSPIKPT